MSYLPSYPYPCLAAHTSPSTVFLVGVPPATEGRLEIYTVNLANANSPVATFYGNQTRDAFWSSAAAKICLSYPGNTASTNNPLLIIQFGEKSYFTNLFPNGNINIPTNFLNIGFVSNKLFSLSGAVGSFNWFTAVTNASSTTTNSPWTGLRFNATDVYESSRDYIISNYPNPNPILSVGTYVASSNTPAQGYNVVFDRSGGGSIYTALSSAAPIVTTQDRILTLSTPQTVDMGGVKLSNNAISTTMVGSGYILDKMSDGSTRLYSINPAKSNKLETVAVNGNVPMFASNMAVTTMGNSIVTYGSAGGNAIINVFDTVSLTWSGQNLVAPPAPNTPPAAGGSDPTNPDGGSKSAPLGAIIGGVVGGLALIALIAFLVIRSRRKPKTKAAVQQAPNNGQNNAAAAPPVDPNYALQQQQQAMVQTQPVQYQQQQFLQQQQQFPPQQQQYNPHQSVYLPQQQPLYAVPDKTAPPVIFQPVTQPQEGYNYVPPTLFQPAETSPPTKYSQDVYVPPTPYTPSSHTYTPTTTSATPASPQYLPPGHRDDYAA
ncbi:hypothetical protein BGX34_009029 [Mortierella sp. NVP85]|nr:hypothetical protein BGX34_009029 [Mortierella sp. NVP85]